MGRYVSFATFTEKDDLSGLTHSGRLLGSLQSLNFICSQEINVQEWLRLFLVRVFK